MAKQSGITDRLYVGGFNISGDVGSIDTLSTLRSEIDVTGLDKSAHERVLGLADVNISFNAFYNDASGRAHPALSSLQSTKRQVLYCRGSTKGQAGFFFQGKQINYDPTREAQGALLVKVDIHGSEGDPPEWGILICNAGATFAAASTATSIDDVAASSEGAAAMMQVQKSTGTLTVSIKDSTDNALWTSLVAFAASGAGSSRDAQRVTVAGRVNRYLRVSSAGTATFTAAVALRRGSTAEIITY